MGVSVGELFAELGLDTSRFDNAVKGVGQRFTDLGGVLTRAGAGLTAGVTLPLAAVGTAAIKAGMEAMESENLFEVSFGNMATAARAWSEDLSDSLGLSAFELRRTSGTFFTMFESMGLARGEAYEMSTGLVELAHDMASFYNLRPEEAFEKLRAGITGEIEPLKRLGILVDEATVKQVAYSAGIAKHGEELTQVQKVQARHLAIMQQTSKAQGDLARTMDSPTNQLRRMREQLHDLTAELGMALMPAFQKLLDVGKGVVEWIKDAVRWFSSLPEPVRTAAATIAGVAAAIGPLLVAGGMLLSSLGSIATAFGGTAAAAGALKLSLALLGPALLVVSAAIAGYKLGSWWREWSGVGEIVDKVTMSVTRFGFEAKKALEPTIPQVVAMQKASELVGRPVRDWAEATEILNKHLNEERGALAEAATVAETHVKSLQDQARELLAAAEETDKLGKASQLAGQQIKDLALAEEILRQATATEEAELRALNRALADAAVEMETFWYSTDRSRAMNRAFGDMLIEILPAIEMDFIPALDRARAVSDAFGEMGVDVGRRWLKAKANTEQATGALVSFTEVLQQAASLSQIFGRGAATVFGGLASAAGGLQGLFGREGGFGSMFRVPADAAKNAGAITFTSFLGGMASAIPMIGAVAGPAIALLGKLFGRGWKKISKEGARLFGRALSEDLSKEIEKVAKHLGSVQNAMAARIGDIVSEVGVTGENVQEVARHMHYLIGMVGNGTVQASEAIGQLSTAFGPVVAQLEQLGTEGAFQIGKMVSRMRELGLVTGEVAEQVNQWIDEAIASLGTYFEYLSKKTEDGGYAISMSMEQAESAVVLLTSAFAAAIEKTGNLYDAVMTLPDSFGALMERLRHVIGAENEAFIQMDRLYSFIIDNEEALGAIHALGDALIALAKAGLLTEESLSALAQSISAEIDRLLADTAGNWELVLASIGPVLATLLQGALSVGLSIEDLPPTIQRAIEKAEELGISLEPPQGTSELLGEIRDILRAIGEYMGAIREESLNPPSWEGWEPPIPPDVPRPPGRGRQTPPRTAQSGMNEILRRNELILAHAGEHVQITPASQVGQRRIGPGAHEAMEPKLDIHIHMEGAVVGDERALSRLIAGGVAHAIRTGEGGTWTAVRTAYDRRA